MLMFFAFNMLQAIVNNMLIFDKMFKLSCRPVSSYHMTVFNVFFSKPLTV
jgi:hypothetical protein